MEITTEGAQSLRIMKMRNAELYFKEATVIYGFHPRGARLPQLAPVKVGKTRLLPVVQLRAQEQAFS